jgi:DNA-directed RNA polymerase subunit RPC12/RpoP
LLKSRYLFVWREKKVQMAYCTHCQTEFPLGVGQASFKHNEKTTCLSCGSECVVKHRGLGRKKLIDEAYVVWYDKSVLNPNAIVARAMLVLRDYREDFHAVETQYLTQAMYLFEPGRGGHQFRLDWDNGWREMRSVYSYVMPRLRTYSFFASSREGYCCEESIANAVAGTPLQYSMWREYANDEFDLVQFFDLAAKYPCVEYLTKLGLRAVVLAKLRGDKTYGAVNWRGKSLEKVLRMPKTDLRQLRDLRDVTPRTLHSYHYWRKRGWMLSPSEAKKLEGFTDSHYYEDMLKEMASGSEVEAVKYLLKQMNRENSPYESGTYALTEWRDTLKNCKELGMDVNQPHVRFPSNLREAHDKAMRKVKVKRDESLNALIAERLPALAMFIVNDGVFLVRPAESSIELFDEGKALNHCVGSYSDRYAKGQTDLFVVRKASEPDTPFCTVEVNQGKIVQARGYKNSTPGSEVQAFLKRFERSLQKKRTQAATAQKAS